MDLTLFLRIQEASLYEIIGLNGLGILTLIVGSHTGLGTVACLYNG